MLQDKKYGLTQNLLATRVMPTLIPYTATPGLDLEQVNIHGHIMIFREHTYYYAVGRMLW
jgi:hypothetical protein